VAPTIYGGSSLDCALMETIFRDVPYSPGLKTLSLEARVAGRMFSMLAATSDLTLIDLSSIALRKLGISRKHLLETEKEEYPASRAWALALYLQFPAAQGLVWTSRQDDRARACVLFGDRVGGDTLRAVSGPTPLTNSDGSARLEVLDLARRLNVEIVD